MLKQFQRMLHAQLQQMKDKPSDVNYLHRAAWLISSVPKSAGYSSNNCKKREKGEKKSMCSSFNERQLPPDLLPSSVAEEEVWIRSDSCTPGCTFCPAPPDIWWRWSSAPWWGGGSGHFSSTRRCTEERDNRRFTGTAISQFTHRYFPVFW